MVPVGRNPGVILVMKKGGIMAPADVLARDRIDLHTTFQHFFWVPAEVTRNDLDIKKRIEGKR